MKNLNIIGLFLVMSSAAQASTAPTLKQGSTLLTQLPPESSLRIKDALNVYQDVSQCVQMNNGVNQGVFGPNRATSGGFNCDICLVNPLAEVPVGDYKIKSVTVDHQIATLKFEGNVIDYVACNNDIMEWDFLGVKHETPIDVKTVKNAFGSHASIVSVVEVK